MRYKLAQAVGLNSDQTAAQVTSETLGEDSLFLAVIKLTCDDAFTKGREVLSQTAESYLSAEGSSAQKLTTAFEEAKVKVAETENPSILLGCISGKALYLIKQGEIDAYLKRFDKLSPLFPSDGSNNGSLISGFIQDGDRVFFGTNSLTAFLGENLNESLEASVDEWKEDLNSKMTASNFETAALAGLLLSVEDEEVVTIPKSGGLEDRVEGGSLQGEPYISSERSRDRSVFPKVSLSFIKRLLPNSGRGRLVLAVLLIIVIGLGAGFKYKTAKDSEKNQAIFALLSSAQADLDQAVSLKDLNPGEAQNKLSRANEGVEKALSLDPQNKQALDLRSKIEGSKNNVLQKFESVEMPLYLDLDLIKKGLQAQKLSLSVGKLLILDSEGKTLVAVDLSKKSNQVLAGEKELGKATLASINGSMAFVYSEDKGLVKVDVTNQKDSSVAKVDKEWGKIVDIAGFASNVYLLDSGSNKIWKYLPTSAGYSDKREYFNKGVKADFGSSLRMQIESSIYVLKQDGSILRFTKGASDFFSYDGLDKGVKDPKSFFVSSDTENLYLLDSGNSRLLVLGKTGAYKKQYQSDRFATASDLVVDEKEKKVYILDGNKIYVMELK